jgi:hypothetical protein
VDRDFVAVRTALRRRGLSERLALSQALVDRDGACSKGMCRERSCHVACRHLMAPDPARSCCHHAATNAQRPDHLAMAKPVTCENIVGGTGLDPVTSSVSGRIGTVQPRPASGTVGPDPVVTYSCVWHSESFAASWFVEGVGRIEDFGGAVEASEVNPCRVIVPVAQ